MRDNSQSSQVPLQVYLEGQHLDVLVKVLDCCDCCQTFFIDVAAVLEQQEWVVRSNRAIV